MAHRAARRQAANAGERYAPYPKAAACSSASAASSGCSCGDDGASHGRRWMTRPPLAAVDAQRSGQPTERSVKLLRAAVAVADHSLAAASAAFERARAAPCDSPLALQALEQAEAHMAKASRTTVLAVHLASALVQRQSRAYGLAAPLAPAGLPAMLLALQQQQARMQALAEQEDGEEVSSCCTTAAL